MRWALTCCALLIGCGGKVDSDVADSGEDAAVDVVIAVDTSPAPDTTPSPVDATMSTCPALTPKANDRCPEVGQVCDYTLSCGGTARARCGGSGGAIVWVVEIIKPCPGVCPPSPLGFTTRCSAKITCEYTGPCGPITSKCPGSFGAVWQASMGMCPTSSCPTSEPAVGDTCLAPGKCTYTTACGGETVYCDGTGFALGIDYALCAGCPKTEPAEGSACSGTAPCWYANECGRRNEAKCVGGVWVTSRTACSK